MADKKWLLAPGPLEPMPLGMNCKPWYKDRLPSKCLAKHKNRLLKFPTSLDGRRWVFVKEGLDDFRRGCPPCEDIIIRGRKEGFLPVIAHRVPQPAPPKSEKKPPKEAGQFSTLSSAQLARKAFVEDIEARLTEHPLAHYPSLEEDLPADLLLKVLEVLDPDRKLADTWAYCQGTRKRTKPPTKLSGKCRARAYLDLPKKTPVSHPDNLLHEEKSSTTDLPPEPPSLRRAPRGIRKFCKWIATFGDVGIDEEFIINLCKVDFQYKPTYDTGHIKKINMLSSKLKYSLTMEKMKEIKFSTDEINWAWKLQKPHDPYKVNRVKMRYGAWYLKPKLWKKLINDEPLIDPEEDFRRKALQPDILEDLYGTIAFKDFIVSKGYRMPDILEKLFLRKGWNYDSVKTPLHRVIRMSTNVEEDSQEEI
uniref:Protein FAM47E n=1 Tax=Equus asinus TaxID=9793 RepID=A0A8C4MFM6_EQUAS|nr:protein FAM47A-like [Equus asinus]